MDLVELNENGDCIEDVSAEHPMSLESPDAYNVFGDPEVLPRVGDKYQVAIPQLISESEYLLYKKSPTDAENGADAPCDFLMGLPLPIMWISKEVEGMKTETPEYLRDSSVTPKKNGLPKFESIRETQSFTEKEDSKVKFEFFDATLDCGAGVEESANLDSKEKMSQWKGPGYCLVPGSHGDFWSDTEKASFILGLYIFEKNFVQVKRFIEVKEMGEILSFYYGKFYRSDEYRKCSACRKMRSRKAVYGQRLFNGPRLQELLSRLLPHVSTESKNDLFQVSKTFGEGKIQLEEYVSSLKSMVGINILVEAVGIGKGKQDLTNIATEPSKSNQVIRMHSEIPSGKACSSLMPREIIKFLTGDYRLSKARSNDLFWEAVWPRLLARGWHSEQPNNKQAYAAGSKHSLVFLVPGIKKFSRRRLVKGSHYYDSVTDVLSKVASEPGLLELENEEDEGKKSKEVCEWPNGTKSEQDDLPDRKRPCYLQPRTSNRITDVVKFTIVDTSLADGRSSKVRELRTLPVEISIRSHSGDSDVDTSDVSTDESNCAYTLLMGQEENTNTKSRRTISDRRTYSEGEDEGLETSASHQEIYNNGPDYTNVPIKNFKNRNSLSKDKKKTKVIKNLDRLPPVGKRQRRLSACSHAETSHRTNIFSVESGCEQDMRDCGSSAPVLAENILSQIGSSQDKLSSTSSSRDGPLESIEGAPNCDDRHSSENLYGQLQKRTMIDLNLPQVEPDFETDVFMTDSEKGPNAHPRTELDNLNPLKSSAGSDQQPNPNVNSQRQSTRNRPPTARALEALANGYLTIRKKRSKETTGREISKSRPSQRARSGPRVDEFSTVSSSVVSEGENGACNDEKSNMFDDYQFLSLRMGNGTHEL